MEARSRSFEPVKIGMVHVEPASERFNQEDGRQAPAIAYWRVNLTALSQRYNLYFVATRDVVQVYVPDFPFQTLGEIPSLTIVPQLVNPDAQGYIDLKYPHNINHLTVGALGNQEILLFSTDSGNVLAYYTSSINSAITNDAHQLSVDGNADSVGVRPFFAQWVRRSAWGLAIHSEGRMIAISANTPHDDDDDDDYNGDGGDDLSSKITVFAFALTTPDNGTEGEMDDMEDGYDMLDNAFEWHSWSTPHDRNWSDGPKRDCNYKIVLAGPGGHKNNVPCITFVNGPEDTTGSWLLSTDITGEMKMWQVWKGRCFKTWDFKNQGEAVSPWTGRYEAGWVVAALDINAFRPAKSMDKFVGHHRAPQYYGYRSSGNSYDLTGTVQRFTPQNSHFHPIIMQSEGDTSDEDEDELDGLIVELDEDTSHVLALSLPTLVPETTPPRTQSESTQAIDTQSVLAQPGYGTVMNDGDDVDDVEQTEEDNMEFDPTDDVSEDENDEDDDESADANEIDLSPGSVGSATSLSSNDSGNSDGDEVLYENDLPVGSGFVSSSTSQQKGKKANARSALALGKSKPKDQTRLPQIPILQCSTSHVRLFHGPTAKYPHIFCARMLQQVLPEGMEDSHLAALDRLSMSHQIPELGIVLIATQLGRCAVCSLTKRSKDGLLGFRVDWILPTKRQERARARPPNHVLLGITAGPIQGRASPDPTSSVEHDTDRDWAKDRIIDGTPTTFDPDVVVLDVQQLDQEPNGDDSRRHTYIERRVWVKPTPIEEWRSHESSRRYRLMLTYSDMTVLTYELSRGLEKDDIGVQVRDD